MDDENAEEYAERLYDFYSTGHYNLYSATYSWMHRSPTDESDLEYLDRNFKKIMDAYKKKHPDDKNGLLFLPVPTESVWPVPGRDVLPKS